MEQIQMCVWLSWAVGPGLSIIAAWFLSQLLEVIPAWGELAGAQARWAFFALSCLLGSIFLGVAYALCGTAITEIAEIWWPMVFAAWVGSFASGTLSHARTLNKKPGG